MAKKILTSGYLVIEASAKEMIEAVGQRAMCDLCDERADKYYYVAVNNEMYCPECFADWRDTAMDYDRDLKTERRNFNRYAELLNVSKC